MSKQINKQAQANAKKNASQRTLTENAQQTWALCKTLAAKLEAEGSIATASLKEYADTFARASSLSDNLLEAVCQPLIKDDYYGEQAKWVLNHVREMSVTSSAAEITKPAVAKRVSEIIMPCVPAAMRAVFAHAKGETWLIGMFAYQFWLAVPGHQHVATTPFCLGECRIMLEGSLVLCGLPIEKAPGTDIARKIALPGDMPLDSAADLFKAHGFQVTLAPGMTVVIPPNYLVVEVVKPKKIAAKDASASGDGLSASCVRWSFLPPDFVDAAAGSVSQVIELWPAMKGTVFAKLAQKIDALRG